MRASRHLTGRERWDFELQNQAGSPLTGAQVIAKSGSNLTDPSFFRFVATLATFGPAAPGPPASVSCSISPSGADCPASPSTLLLPAGSTLAVDANDSGGRLLPWLRPGVPKPMTPGYDSAVRESAFVGGTASLHVLVTLRDAARYVNPVNPSQVQVKIDGNAVAGSETVTTSLGPVPPCMPGPPLTTCFRVLYRPGLCHASEQGDGSANFFLDLPQLGVTYDLGSSQTVTPGCPKPPARPHIKVAAQRRSHCFAGTACSTTANSVTIQDPDLQGSVTYQVDQATDIQGFDQTQWSVDYLPCRGVPAVVSSVRRCLRAGQHCNRRLERQYHRYGFYCHSGRLTRSRKP